MEDKEVKKRLKKVPDVDKDGEPILKIESAGERREKSRRAKVPLFLRKSRSSAQGNQQDEKDETPE
jgi:hypothetical protein